MDQHDPGHGEGGHQGEDEHLDDGRGELAVVDAGAGVEAVELVAGRAVGEGQGVPAHALAQCRVPVLARAQARGPLVGVGAHTPTESNAIIKWSSRPNNARILEHQKLIITVSERHKIGILFYLHSLDSNLWTPGVHSAAVVSQPQPQVVCSSTSALAQMEFMVVEPLPERGISSTSTVFMRVLVAMQEWDLEKEIGRSSKKTLLSAQSESPFFPKY